MKKRCILLAIKEYETRITEVEAEVEDHVADVVVLVQVIDSVSASVVKALNDVMRTAMLQDVVKIQTAMMNLLKHPKLER